MRRSSPASTSFVLASGCGRSTLTPAPRRRAGRARNRSGRRDRPGGRKSRVPYGDALDVKGSVTDAGRGAGDNRGSRPPRPPSGSGRDVPICPGRGVGHPGGNGGEKELSAVPASVQITTASSRPGLASGGKATRSGEGQADRRARSVDQSTALLSGESWRWRRSSSTTAALSWLASARLWASRDRSRSLRMLRSRSISLSSVLSRD